MNLSQQQEQAVLHTLAPAIITAGAGSGKTRTLTHKFAYLTKHGMDPHRILCITFTNKAANELKQRLHLITGIHPSNFPWVRTIHSACLQMLKPYVGRLDFKDPVTIYTSSDQKKILRDVIKSHKINPKEVLMSLSSIFSEAKDSLNPNVFLSDLLVDNKHLPEEVRKHARHIRSIFEKYTEILKSRNAFDFDDILWNTYKILQHEDILKRYQYEFQYIMVDEFQDVNNIQYEIVKRLVSCGNITVVGDDYQAIYGWRGSNPKFFINFEHQFEDTKVFRLEENFRSAQPIVDVSNQLIKKNKDQLHKNCFSNIKSDIQPTIVRFDNDTIESELIAKNCKQYELNGINLNDVAILYRAKYLSRGLEIALVNEDVPYQIIGSVEFFERREVKDIMSYLNMAINPRDVIAFERSISAPKRGVGKKSIQLVLNQTHGETIWDKCNHVVKAQMVSPKACDALYQWMNIVDGISRKPPGEAIIHILKSTEYYKYLQSISTDEDDLEDRSANISEFKNFASKYLTISEFIEECSLYNSGSDEADSKEKQAVKLMTGHSSKGLEFKIVFIVGLEDGILPHRLVLKSDKEHKHNKGLEEERRLFYVMMTRAEQVLNISYCKERTCSFSKYPSRFLKNIESKCTHIKYTGQSNGSNSK